MKIVNTHIPGIAQFTGARLDAGLAVMYVLADARPTEQHPHSYRVYKGIVALGTDYTSATYESERADVAVRIAIQGTKCRYEEARLQFPSLRSEEYN